MFELLTAGDPIKYLILILKASVIPDHQTRNQKVGINLLEVASMPSVSSEIAKITH